MVAKIVFRLSVFFSFLLSPLSGQTQPTLQVLHRHVPAAVASGQAALVGPMPATQQMNFSIVLPLRNQSELTSLLSQLYDPSSPDYRHFLSVGEFTQQFGPTAEDYQAVLDFARAHGMTVTAVPANRMLVPVRATVAQVEQAFNVKMNRYRHPTENRNFFSPDREPTLELKVPVAHIAGLDNFSIPRRVLAEETEASAGQTGSAPGGYYLGSDLRTAYYGGAALTGAGQAVALPEFGCYFPLDVDLYFSTAGQVNGVPINNVLLDGATTSCNQGDTEEVLDITQAIGMAPGLNQVRVYIGTVPEDILNAIASEDVAKQISASWLLGPDSIASCEPIFQEFATQGQTVFAASGDSGAYPATNGGYPPESNFVTGVGGTVLLTNGPGGAWDSESTWTQSGGGISPDGIAIPSWQTGVANSSNGASTSLRNVPDVAANAASDYICAVFSCVGVAGTSAAAPLWAGFMALVNQQAVESGTAPMGGLGLINPALYAIGEGPSYDNDFHDISGGNNSCCGGTDYYMAVAGYDLVTGWGSPNGQSLIDDLAGPATPGFTLTYSTMIAGLSIDQGASGSTTITVNDLGGFTGSVALAVSGLPSGVTASFSPPSTTGTSVLTLTASSNAAAGTYYLTVTGTSGAMTATAQVAVTIVAPGFTLSVPPGEVFAYPGGTPGTVNVAVTDLDGFSGSINFSVSPLPTGVTASFGPNPTTGSSLLTLTADSSAAIQGTVLTITGSSGSITSSTQFLLEIVAPSFSLSASPSTVSVSPGSSATSIITVVPIGAPAGSVSLTLASETNLPNGVTASLGSNSTTGICVLTVSANSTAQPGSLVGVAIVSGTTGSWSTTVPVLVAIPPPSPGFGLSTSSSAVTVNQGASGTTTVTVEDLLGFAGSVSLAASGLPSGVTQSWSANPTTGSSVLTLSSSSSAGAGMYPVTITGSSGTLTATTQVALTVLAPGFTLSTSTGTVYAAPGGSPGEVNMTVQDVDGFTGGVSLALSQPPVGVTYGFNPNPTAGTSVLTLTASSSATMGTYNLTVTGTSGSVTASTNIAFAVAEPTISDTLSPPGLVISQGSSGTTIASVTPLNGFTGDVTQSMTGLPSGVTASFSPNPITITSGSIGTSVLKLTADSTAAAGVSNPSIEATFANQVVFIGFKLTVNAEPGFTLSAAPASMSVVQGASNAATITVSDLDGFSGAVDLSASGLPSGVTAQWGTNPATGSSLLTLTASSAAATGPATVTITGTSGSLTASTSIALTVNPPPGFTLSASPSSLTMGQGGSGTTTVTVTPAGGFTGNVALTAVLTSSPNDAVDPPTLSFGSTTPVGITGASAGTATLTVTTTAPTSSSLVRPKRPGVPWNAAAGTTLACILLFAVPARKRGWRTMLGMLIFFGLLTSGVLSCGGGSGGGGGGGGGGGNSGTTAGAYTITVTGNLGSTTATGTVVLNVQ